MRGGGLTSSAMPLTNSPKSSSASVAAASGSAVATRARRSSRELHAGAQSSVKRDRSAGDSSRLPWSPPGFIVASSRNAGCAVTTSSASPPFSASAIVRAGSRTLFNRSNTASSARFSSSSSTISPRRIASTRHPSTHSNNAPPLSRRAGRSAPRKSDASEWRWQFRTRNGCPRIAASSWHAVVLPPPVSPTRSTGSSWSSAAPMSCTRRAIAAVGATFCCTHTSRTEAQVLSSSRSASRACEMHARTARTSAGHRSRCASRSSPTKKARALSALPPSRFAHLSTSRAEHNAASPSSSVPPSRPRPSLSRARRRRASTSFAASDGGTPPTRFTIWASSSGGGSSTWISTKRSRKARDRGLRPPYCAPDVAQLAGFCVAKSRKFACGVMTSPVSGRRSSRLSSSNLFSASRTSGGARFNSSSRIHSPRRTAPVSAPSSQPIVPSGSGAYRPTYSATSVCSWLLMRAQRTLRRRAR